MSRTFCFVGDPGPGKELMLDAIRKAELVPQRLDASGDIGAKLDEDPPLGIVLGTDVRDRRDLLASLRENSRLAPIPVLARVASTEPDLVAEAFSDGIDDILVDPESSQFSALAAMLQQKDPWSAVRAPAGLVLLADQDRTERIQLSRILRRNGFDIHFAADASELEQALRTMEPRAVIARADLPGGSPFEAMEGAATTLGGVPWIFMVPDEDMERVSGAIDGKSNCSLLRADGDSEELTFVMNELLTPAPPKTRRSERLLFGTTVTFKPEGSEEEFCGYCYNINVGGMFIRTLTTLPKQTRIQVRFRPPFGKGEIVATAQVVWCKEFAEAGGAKSPPGIGIQFVGWSLADRTAYEAGYQALLEANRIRSRGDDQQVDFAALQEIFSRATRPAPQPIC